MRASLKRMMMLLAVVAGVLLTPHGLQGQGVEWIMGRRIGPPAGLTGSGYAVGVVPVALDDHDGNAYPDFICGVNITYPTNRLDVLYRMTDGAGFAVRWETILPSPPPVLSHSAAILSSPNGTRLASIASGQGSVVFYLPSLHQVIANLPLPPPPVGFPAPLAFVDLLVAGDTEGDGYEDLYARMTATDHNLNQQYVVFGRIDGASLQFSWVLYLPSSVPEAEPPLPLFAEPWSDLDQDGFTDVVLGNHNAPGSAVMTLSGRDGSTLWETSSSNEMFDFWTILNDIDGDGIREIGCLTAIDWVQAASIREPGALRVLDGATGAVLWNNPYGSLIPWLNTPGHQKRVSAYNLCGSGDHDRDGYPDLIVDMHESENYLALGYYMAWVFSGRDGSFVGRESTALTQFPWSSEPLQGGGSRSIGMIRTVPDLDRDGWPERLTSYAAVGSSYSPAIDLIILQRRSLRVGARLHLGSAANYELHLPACGGLSYAVLFSGSFSPWPGGLRFGPWNVALGIDPVLLTSSQQPALSGVLGPNGVAQGTFPMSSDARLLGRTLFSRAVVLDAAAPGGVRTLSSIEYSTVVP